MMSRGCLADPAVNLQPAGRLDPRTPFAYHGGSSIDGAVLATSFVTTSDRKRKKTFRSCYE